MMSKSLASIEKHKLTEGNPQQSIMNDCDWNNSVYSMEDPPQELLAIVEAKESIGQRHIVLSETLCFDDLWWPHPGFNTSWGNFEHAFGWQKTARNWFAHGFNKFSGNREREYYAYLVEKYTKAIPPAQELVKELEEALSNADAWDNQQYVPPMSLPEKVELAWATEVDEPRTEEDVQMAEACAEYDTAQEEVEEAISCDEEKPDWLDSLLSFVFKAKMMRKLGWTLQRRIQKLTWTWPQSDPWIRECWATDSEDGDSAW